MIRNLLVLLILLLSTQQAYSQVLISLLFGDKLNSDKIEFGLEGGVNFSSMSDFESNSVLRTFNLGFYFDIKLKDNWFLTTGVIVKSNVGVDKLSEADVSILDPTTIYSDSGSYSQKINYFYIPAAIKYRFDNHMYLFGGPQIGLRTKAHLLFDGTTDNKSVEIKTDNRDIFNRFDAGLLVGTGYKLKQGTGMNITVKYYYGLANVLKDSPNSPKNRSFYLTVGIPIGRGKTEEAN